MRAPCSPLTLTVCVGGNGGATGAPRVGGWMAVAVAYFCAGKALPFFFING